MRTIIALLLAVGAACAADFIPVDKFPNPVTTPDGKTWYNPTPALCVSAGYRILTPKPSPPTGFQEVSAKVGQDPVDAGRCKYTMTYELIPEPVKPPDPPVYAPEQLTNVAISARLSAYFTTNGEFRAFGKLDVPATNIPPVKVTK